MGASLIRKARWSATRTIGGAWRLRHVNASAIFLGANATKAEVYRRLAAVEAMIARLVKRTVK